MQPVASSGPPGAAISSELAVLLLLGFTVLVAILVYLFALSLL